MGVRNPHFILNPNHTELPVVSLKCLAYFCLRAFAHAITLFPYLANAYLFFRSLRRCHFFQEALPATMKLSKLLPLCL